jgi:hypothetical protein
LKQRVITVSGKRKPEPQHSVAVNPESQPPIFGSEEAAVGRSILLCFGGFDRWVQIGFDWVNAFHAREGGRVETGGKCRLENGLGVLEVVLLLRWIGLGCDAWRRLGLVNRKDDEPCYFFNPILCPQAVFRKPAHEDARDDLPIVNFLVEVRPLGCVLA